jgi:hypothetical protein
MRGQGENGKDGNNGTNRKFLDKVRKRKLFA